MILDENGQEIPNTTKGLLEYIHERNQYRESSERTTDISDDVRGTIQSYTVNHTRVNSKRREEAPIIHGRDGSDENSTTGSNGTTKQNGYTDRQPTGRDSGIYQHAGRTRESNFKNASQSIKTAWNKYNPFNPYKQKKEIPKKKETVSAKKFTEVEAAKYKDDLIEFYLWTCEHLDNFITATTKGHEEVEIWSNLDRVDCECLADYTLMRAQEDGKTAQLVRKVSNFKVKLKAYVIVTPRMYATAWIYFRRGIHIALR